MIPNHKDLIENEVIPYVKSVLKDAEGGHDWFHINRVWKLSKQIASAEKSNNLMVVEFGALLHDIADSKFHDGDETVGPKMAKAFMEKLNLDNDIVEHVLKIIDNISFKGGNFNQNFKSIELDIVQDADRMDALGAIGIARTFNYGGFKNRTLYDPAILPNLQMTKEEYKNSTAPTLNHFYEKLFLLKDRMNTKSGKAIAQKRHDFMVKYVDEFMMEWNVD